MLHVVLAGGLGGVGREISDALLQRGKSRLTVFTRKLPSEALTPRNVDEDRSSSTYRVVKVDYSDVNELASHLQNVDVVLSFVLDYDNKVQKNLIDACMIAKVKRFAPSEWVWANYSGIELFKYKDDARSYLEQINAQGKVLEYCLFQPGMFMNYLSFPKKSASHLHLSPIPIDVQNYKAITLEGENPHVVFTTVQDLARVVALAVEHTLPWPTVGQICGTRTTVKDLISLAEQIRGTHFEIHQVRRTDLELGKMESPWTPQIIHSSVPPDKVEEMSRQLSINWLLAAARESMDVSPTWNYLLPGFKPTQVTDFLNEHFS
ncbi:uncharacterized protein Z518_08910 [Rhinocladiella mackenziei CBS 650.93]|uniref:NmrA-like domain-containing protein n=1 Tax=Rhinocladiella mackenziei CBS 650.93 TaxID=1442369 RepID=A0A0D2IX49_9EURO|nr:uncharacterized protein Z518_08910 [Rhinocladiella mackenziei CBS 650.93]KIX01185.1 hypothetical protein Z518_08910 [Rhinocladiella mackenziei CBS 650.93]